MARVRDDEFDDLDRMGRLSPYVCPSCHGSLWEIDDEHVLRYRCHTGNAFTAEELEQGQDENV